jgi:hypothetical protein
MKTITTVFLISMLLFSCKNEEKKVLIAESVELAYDNCWTVRITLRVMNNGIVYYSIYDIRNAIDKTKCYKDTLNRSEIDSINLLLTAIKTGTIDSFYDGHCQDCGVYLFLINFPDTALKSTIIGTNEIENKLSKLAEFLLKKMPKDENRVDSCFYFKLKSCLEPPPPPPDDYHRFVPPVDE